MNAAILTARESISNRIDKRHATTGGWQVRAFEPNIRPASGKTDMRAL